MNKNGIGKFIVYLCPTGELNKQLKTYFAQSRQLYGVNTAHKYMPHCTLTVFFEDKVSSVGLYLTTLERVYVEARTNNVNFALKINGLTFSDR